MPNYNWVEADIVPGYFNSAGIFVAAADDPDATTFFLASVAKGFKPVFRGPVILGNGSNGGTLSEYLFPKQADLVHGTHFAMKTVTVLSGSGVAGDAPTTAYMADNTTAVSSSNPTTLLAVVALDQPGNATVPGGVPPYWYVQLDPRGSTETLAALEKVEFSLTATLPYAVGTIAGAGGGLG